MSEEITIQGEQSSAKYFHCLKGELPDKAAKLEEYSLIQVTDEGNRPYILLKDIDDKPYWHPYGGESREDIEKFHKWELEAQKEIKEKQRSPEEMNTIRNILMSIGVLSQFLELDAEFVDFLLASALDKITLYLIRNDKNDQTYTLQDTDEEKKYFSIANYLVRSFYMTMGAIATGVRQSDNKVPSAT